MKTIVLLLFAGLFASVAYGQVAHTVPPGTNDTNEFRTGNELLTACQSTALVDQAFCLGYIVGVADAVGVIQAIQKDGGKLAWTAICFPEGSNAEQVKDIVVKYLVESPETRNKPAGGLILLALIRAWGCPAPPAK